MLDHLRSDTKIPECGSFKAREPKSIPPPNKIPSLDEESNSDKTNDVVSKEAFGNVRLSEAEENNVYLSLVEFLNDKFFYRLSQKGLEYVSDKDSVRVKFAKAKSLMLLQKTQEAEVLLYDLFTNVDSDLMDAHIMYGHCKFVRN